MATAVSNFKPVQGAMAAPQRKCEMEFDGCTTISRAMMRVERFDKSGSVLCCQHCWCVLTGVKPVYPDKTAMRKLDQAVEDLI